MFSSFVKSYLIFAIMPKRNQKSRQGEKSGSNKPDSENEEPQPKRGRGRPRGGQGQKVAEHPRNPGPRPSAKPSTSESKSDSESGPIFSRFQAAFYRDDTFSNLKREGNNIFMSTVNSEDLTSAEFQSKMLGALRLYFQAERVAKEMVDISSIHKNIGTAYNRIGTKFRKDFLIADKVKKSVLGDKIVIYLEMGLQYLEMAIGESIKYSVQSFQWIQDLKEKFSLCIETVWEVSEEIHSRSGDPKKLNGELHKLCMKFKGDARCHLFYRLGTMVFNKGIKDQEKGNHEAALSVFIDNQFNIEEAKRNSGNDQDFKDWVQDLGDSVYIHICICESVKARKRGDEYWVKATHDMENLDMDLVWDAVDEYLHAIIYSREKCLESEAHAHSKLGKLYESLLITDKSREHYKSVFELVEALKPRNLTDKDWHKVAQDGLSRFQEIDMEKERKEREKLRDPHLEALKPILDKLDEADNGTVDELLDYIYTYHPPKKGSQPAKDGANNKKLRTALLHYHPDKQDKTEYRGYFLCEEITKILNGRYVVTKGMQKDD